MACPVPSVRSNSSKSALEQFHSRGFHNCSVEDITRAAGVPKGSFYNHFASKDALAVEALQQYQQRSVWRTTDDADLPPLIRLRHRFEAMRAVLTERGYTRGCLIGNMGTELADLNPAVRAEVQASLDYRSAATTELLRAAQERGDLSHRTSIPDVLGPFLIDAWEGVVTAHQGLQDRTGARRILRRARRIVRNDFGSDFVKLSRTTTFWLVVAAYLALMIAASTPSPLYVVYQAEWHFPTSTLTVMFGVYALALLTSLLTVGGLSDFIGRRPVLIGALALLTAAMIVFANADGVAWLYVARMMQGLAAGAAIGTLSASIVALAPTGQGTSGRAAQRADPQRRARPRRADRRRVRRVRACADRVRLRRRGRRAGSARDPVRVRARVGRAARRRAGLARPAAARRAAGARSVRPR